MKTRMKKLISISTIPVLALALLLVLGTVLADGAAAQAKKKTPPLTCTMEYFFVGHLGEEDAEGRLLCWVGPIHGDIDGWAQWWLLPESPPPNAPDTAQVGHMLFRWEIWSESPWMYDEAGNLIFDEDGHLVVNPDVEADLLLAGTENERTIVRHGKNSVWRANGVVTEASEEFEDYIGSQTHDGGNFTWAAPRLPEHGFGTFRIAGSAEGEGSK